MPLIPILAGALVIGSAALLALCTRAAARSLGGHAEPVAVADTPRLRVRAHAITPIGAPR